MNFPGLKYEYDRGVVPNLSPCPGLYCGRTRFDNGSYSACGACPRGFRSFQFACVECNEDLILYDWLYLGFMALLPILLHLSSISTKLFRSSKDTLGLVLCSILEVVTAAAITLLTWEPFGSFHMKSCRTTSISDWYPIFYNPHPNYEETLHCSHEAVYPLYTIVLVFYAIADFLMLIFRFFAHLVGIKVAKSIYAGLYFFPVLALAHLTLGGIIYKIFPYITIITSVISCSYIFSKRKNQDVKNLFLDSVRDWRNIAIILCHWFLHGYGIISITELEDIQRDLCLLALVPLPALLYILTVNFTDPTKVHTN